MITTIDNCPCQNNITDQWCMFRAMTDIWRDMMQEKVISEVRSLKVFVPS